MVRMVETILALTYKETYCYIVSGGMNAYCLYSGRNAARVIAGAIA